MFRVCRPSLVRVKQLMGSHFGGNKLMAWIVWRHLLTWPCQRATRWCVGFNFVRPRATGYQPTEFKGWSMLLVPTGSENLWCRTQIWGWLKVSHCLLHSNLPANLKHLGPWSGLRKRCGIRNGSCLPQFCHLVATRRIGWTLASWVKSCSIQGRKGTRPANCQNKLSGTLIKRCGPSVHVCPWKLSGSPFCF